MPAPVWQNVLSLELGWMAPGQARDFVARALAAGVLQTEPGGEGLRLAPDPGRVEVPRGFRPDPAAVPVQASSEDPFLVWVRRVGSHRGVADEVVLREVAAFQDELGGYVSALAAVLAVAAEAGLDVRAGAQEALDALTAAPAEAPAP